MWYRPFSPVAVMLSLLAAAWLFAACASAPTRAASSDATPLPNAHTVMPGITTAGQPTPAQLNAAKAAGFATVINLRAPDEDGAWDEAPKTAELGMTYVNLPVRGAAGLTAANARALADALAASPTPVLLHCSSGNRAGALLALKAHVVDGMPAEAALQLGLDSGVTKLEPALREALGLTE